MRLGTALCKHSTNSFSQKTSPMASPPWWTMSEAFPGCGAGHTELLLRAGLVPRGTPPPGWHRALNQVAEQKASKLLRCICTHGAVTAHAAPGKAKITLKASMLLYFFKNEKKCKNLTDTPCSPGAPTVLASPHPVPAMHVGHILQPRHPLHTSWDRPTLATE